MKAASTWVSLVALVVLVALPCGCGDGGLGANAPKRSTPIDEDYIYFVRVPALWREKDMQLTEEQRVRLAIMSMAFHSEMGRSAGSQALAAAQKHGQAVRQLLSDEQQKAFAQLFRRKRLMPVHLVTPEGLHGGGGMLIYSIWGDDAYRDEVTYETTKSKTQESHKSSFRTIRAPSWEDAFKEVGSLSTALQLIAHTEKDLVRAAAGWLLENPPPRKHHSEIKSALRGRLVPPVQASREVVLLYARLSDAGDIEALQQIVREQTFYRDAAREALARLVGLDHRAAAETVVRHAHSVEMIGHVAEQGEAGKQVLLAVVEADHLFSADKARDALRKKFGLDVPRPARRTAGGPQPPPGSRFNPNAERPESARPEVAQPKRREPVTSFESALTALRSGDTHRTREGLRWLAAAEPAQITDRTAAREALRPLLSDRNIFLARDAAMAWAPLIDDSERDHLVTILNGAHNVPAWQPALLALLRIDAPAAREIIEARVHDLPFRSTFSRTVSGGGSDYEPMMIAMLDSTNQVLLQEICTILGNMGTRAAIEPMRAAVARTTDRRDNFFLRTRVERAVTQIESRTAQP